MRPWRLAAAASALAASAWAQNAPVQVSPLPPLQQQWQRGAVTAAPGVLPDDVDTNAQAPAPLANAPVAPVAVALRPNLWLPAATAKLAALDKVNAQAGALTVKVGQSATFGSLTIMVKACVTRPPDQPADAAAFVSVTDSHADSPAFDGWILLGEPAASMMQHPVYDLRVTGCA